MLFLPALPMDKKELLCLGLFKISTYNSNSNSNFLSKKGAKNHSWI
jgi:hypothetical protein